MVNPALIMVQSAGA